MYRNLWIEKYRPSVLDDLVLDDKVRSDVLKYKESGEIPHLLFYGDAGGGKTTLAKIIVNDLLDCQYMYINGSEESGVDVVRGKIKDFAERKSLDGKLKVIILDECEGLSSTGRPGSSAQQALRNMMEEYAHVVRFILTTNYYHKIIDPIVSRCITYHITPPLKGYIVRCYGIVQDEHIKVGKKAFVEYAKQFYPDVRRAINAIQRDTVDGVLVIGEADDVYADIIPDVFNHILGGKSSTGLRKMIIGRTPEFSNDYRQLLSNLFNYVYDADIPDDSKRLYLIELSSGLYKHEAVMDKEVNAYATLLKLY